VRALTRAGVAVLAGAALGLASRALAAVPEARAPGVLVAALGIAVCAAAAISSRGGSLRDRLLGGAIVLAATFVASWACAAAAGRAELAGGAAVVAAAATAAHGTANLLRTAGVRSGRATFGGAAAVAMCAGLVFIADPFVEWNAGGPGSLERARAVIGASPIASIAADADVDWQRSKWMYDGPGTGASGLSVIGQYYPSRPTPPFAWAAGAAAAGFLALALSTFRGKRRLSSRLTDGRMRP
jgi:hypothetical protein